MLAKVSGFWAVSSGLDVFDKLEFALSILNEGKIFCVPSKLVEGELTSLCLTSPFAIFPILEVLFAINLEKDDIPST